MQFHYSSYWGIWSRVLQQDNGSYLEVNLTPINGRYDNSTQELWKTEVATIVLREHGTARGRADKECDKLPPMVVTAMIMNVGAELTRRLITADLLSEIDLPTLRAKMRGGGVPLSECHK